MTSVLDPPRNTGRPPKALTEFRLKTILAQITVGVPPQVAAVAAGVPGRTWSWWIAKSREQDAKPPYAGIADRLDAAEAFWHQSQVHVLYASVNKQPKLALEMLARRFPETWGDHGQGVTINNQTNVVVVQEAAAGLLAAAGRALEGYPELLERVKLELAGGEVVDGEAVEVAELVAGG